MATTYQLTITEKQASVIREALEAHSRMLGGQFDIVLTDMFRDRWCTGEFDHDGLAEAHKQLRRMIFPELSPTSYHGVGNTAYPSADVAWDIMQVLRHRLAWDRLADQGGEAGIQVQYHKPMKFGSEPLAQIKTKPERSRDAGTDTEEE